jgi:hypothetical protein
MSRRPQAGGKLLFDDLPDYRFSLYVTNLDLPLDQIWNIYNTRRTAKIGSRSSTRTSASTHFACKTVGPRRLPSASSRWPTT